MVPRGTNTRGRHWLLVLAVLCLYFFAVISPGAVADPDDLEGDEEVISAESMAASMEADDDATEEEGPFDVLGTLGADLACSACELIMDTAQGNMYRVEATLKKEEEAKLKAKEEEKKKAEGEGDEKDTEKETEESSKGDAEDPEKEEEVSADETDTESEKKNDKAKEKGKKDKKKKKKDKKKDKKKSKTPTVSIERRKVADIVVETICNTSYFAGVSAIGKYPGRRYSKYGESYNPTAGLSLDSLNKASQSAKDVVNACKTFLATNKDWLVSSLVSSKKPKSQSKAKKTMCEKRVGVCKSAALGYEAESACLGKALRAASLGEWDNAIKHAKKCPSKAAKKKVEEMAALMSAAQKAGSEGEDENRNEEESASV